MQKKLNNYYVYAMYASLFLAAASSSWPRFSFCVSRCFQHTLGRLLAAFRGVVISQMKDSVRFYCRPMKMNGGGRLQTANCSAADRKAILGFVSGWVRVIIWPAQRWKNLELDSIVLNYKPRHC
jgi:hypothetical protein